MYNYTYYKNVELSQFPFHAYISPTCELTNLCMETPLIVKQMSREYEFIMYGDSSVRLDFPFLGSTIRSTFVLLEK